MIVVSEYQFIHALDSIPQEQADLIRKYVRRLEQEIEGLEMEIVPIPLPANALNICIEDIQNRQIRYSLQQKSALRRYAANVHYSRHG